MTQKIFILALALVLSASCSKFNLSMDSDPIAGRIKSGKEIVNINGTPIGEGYLDMLSDINPRVKSQVKNPMARRQLINNLVEQELMYQESLRRGLDKQKDINQKAALYRRVVIAQALLDAELSDKAKEYYEKNRDTEFAKVSVSGIQINFKPEPEDKTKKTAPVEATPEEKAQAAKKAEEIHARLQKGEDFAKVAAEVSDDKISKKKGGDLGLISKTEKRLERRGLLKIADTAFQMKKDEISKPFETKDSYYIIKVTADPKMTPFEEAENLISFQIRQDVKNELLGTLKKNGKVRYAEAPEAPVHLTTEPGAEGAQTAPPDTADTPPPPAGQGATPPPAQPDTGQPQPAGEPATAPAPANAQPTGEPKPQQAPPTEEKPGTVFKPGTTLKRTEEGSKPPEAPTAPTAEPQAGAPEAPAPEPSVGEAKAPPAGESKKK